MGEKMLDNMFLLYLFLVICLPFQYQIIKVILIILLFLYGILDFFFSKKYIKFSTNWYILYFIYTLSFFLMGILKNFEVFKFYFVSTLGSIIIYFILFNIPKFINIDILKKIEYIYIYAFFINFLFYFLMYIHYNYYSFSPILIDNIVKIGKIIEIQRPGQYNKITVSSSFLVPASFIIPYLTSKYFLEVKKNYIFRLFCWDIVFIIFFIISLRKIQFIIFILTNIFLFIIVKFLANKNIRSEINNYLKWSILIFFILIFINSKYKIYDFSNLISYVLRSFNYSSENTSYSGVFERKIQFSSLMEGFLSNLQTFLIGKGIGSNANVIRSNIPGGYELTYIAMLFQRGIIGTMLYFIFILSFFYKYVKFLSSKQYLDDTKIYVIKYGLGFLGIFLASATNPAFESVEYSWMIFINIFVISILERNK